MTRRFALIVVLTAAALAPAVASAQANAKPQVPAAYLPPKGMCRIWLDGVAADKQPAPTDCATALRNKPAAGQVVFPADETSRPAQTNVLRQQSLVLPGNTFAPPSRGATAPHPSPMARDTTKKDSSKTRRDTVPKKPPPPPA